MKGGLKLTGVWSSPGGDKKLFNDGYTSVSWRKNKKLLLLDCKDVNSIKRKLCLKIFGGVGDCEVVMHERAVVMNCTSCSCNCDELSTDVKGIKLDLVIAGRRNQSNKNNIKRVGEIIEKIQADNDELSKKFENDKNKVSEDLHNHTIPVLPSDYLNSIHSNQKLKDYEKNNTTAMKDPIQRLR